MLTAGVIVLVLQTSLSLAQPVVDGKTLEALQPGRVEIRRTTDGIPHLRAAGWRELGFGIGHVQAEDALCTLAESFVTYAGQRSWFFGAEGRPAHNSTFGRSKNIDLDFFFRAFADDSMLRQYRAQNPPELYALVDGFVAGYNRYLADIRNRSGSVSSPSCRDAPWLREITADDLYRRFYAAQIAGGYARFVPEIVNAAPKQQQTAAADNASLPNRLAYGIGGQPALGSNMFAFGRQATGANEAVLFGNPHWFWGGPDRFYQMHLTIPGQLNVAGVSFLGVPLVMIGFNEQVAWSHTVSEARRFGLFELSLDPTDPVRYRVDGTVEAMRARVISVEARAADGSVQRFTRTLYDTRYGPVVDLGSEHEAFGWSGGRALAMRDINADNFRVFRNFFFWNRARSLDDFMAIQQREAATPWTNTAAIGRGDGRVWYADIGAVPNVPDTLRAACTTPLGQGFAALDPYIPFLDGSRTACNWLEDRTAAQPGAMPSSQMPSLLREDYVANMNDSYWLANVKQPLEGFAAVLGGEREALSLRGRLGHHMALDLLEPDCENADGHTAESLRRRLMESVLTPRVYSAEQFKTELLGQACPQAQSRSGGAAKTDGSSETALTPDSNLKRACRVLRRWSNRGDSEDRGALLWEAFWAQIDELPEDVLSYREEFSPADPLNTPRSPVVAGDGAAQALAAAVAANTSQGIALNAALGSQRYVLTGGRRLPLYGGCHNMGYFVVACGAADTPANALDSNAAANSYLQIVRFGPRGVEAHTLLAHGQQESAVENGAGSAPVVRYARKQWLQFPFAEADIARDPRLTRQVLENIQ